MFQAVQRTALLGRASLGSGGGSSSALFEVPVRYRRNPFRYPKVTYLPFDWDYPNMRDHIRESGDRTMETGLDKQLHKPRLPYSRLPEIETAPDAIKKLYSIEFGSPTVQKLSIKDEFLDRVRRHPFDKESLEYRIAARTYFIRSNRHLYRDGIGVKQNKPLKVRLLESIGRRNKLLNQLRRQDTERYEFVKEMLEIDYTPAIVGKIPDKKTRKSELRRLTQEHADKIREDKLTAYHEQLKTLQKGFEVEKSEAEAWIAKEIEELKLTDEEIADLEYKGKILQ